MGKNSRRSRHTRHDPERVHRLKVADYYQRLIAVGMDEREATRAAMFADVKGFDAMNPPDGSDSCVMFDEPSCGNWDCLNPDHQVLRFENHNHPNGPTEGPTP